MQCFISINLNLKIRRKRKVGPESHPADSHPLVPKKQNKSVREMEGEEEHLKQESEEVLLLELVLRLHGL